MSVLINVRKVDIDRKSTRLNTSHLVISYAVFCLTKKKANQRQAGLDRTTAAASYHEPGRGAPVGRYPLRPYFFFFNDTAPAEIYPLSLHDALPICSAWHSAGVPPPERRSWRRQ